MKAQQKYHDFDLSDFPYDTEAANTYYVYWAKFKERGEELFSDATHTHSYTPQHLVRKILREIDLTGTLLTLNPEFAFELVYINKKDPSEITLWCPTQNHERMAKGLQCNVIRDLFDRTKLTMQFDVVLMNPPYNNETSSRGTSNHKIAGKNLAKDFMEIGLHLSKQSMVAICPYTNRTMSEKARENYAVQGLHTILDVTKEFSITSIICCAIIDRTKSFNLKDVSNDFQTSLPKVASSLADIFVAHPGSGKYPRSQYEHLLQDSGTYKIFITTKVIRYTDDKSIIDKIHDSTRGYWRVVINHNASRTAIGRVVIADPQATLTYNVSCLLVSSKAEAEAYKTYLESETVTSIIQSVRTGLVNTKRDMQYIPQL